MMAISRDAITLLLLTSVCLISGCGSLWVESHDQVRRENSSNGQAFIGRPVEVEPAIRQDTQPKPLREIEPVAGGVEMSTQGSDGDRSANVAASPATESEISIDTPEFSNSEPNAPAVSVQPTASEDSIESTRAQTDRSHRLATTTNILILGSDRRRNTSNWRTDVVMLLALDMEGAVAGVISFPRDIFIEEIPGGGGNRINTIDYLGERNGPGEGPKLLSKILGQKLGISIDNYVRFEFESFKDVVDALGGLTISVDCPIYDDIPEEDLFIDLAPGTQLLDGEQALAFVRTRRNGGDLERIRRQQRVVWAMRQQFLEQNWLPKIPTLYSSLSDAIQTNLGPLEIAQLIRFGLVISENDVHGLVISPPDMLEANFRAGMFVFDANWPLISRTTETVFDRPPFVDTNTVGPSGDQPYCP